MDEIDDDTSPLYQKFKAILSVDTDEKFVKVFDKLTQLSLRALSQLANEHVKLIFNNRQCDELITVMTVLMNPEKCSDPYIRLGLMCFTFIFTNSSPFMPQNVFITISKIVVDNLIPYVEGHLFDSHNIINLINKMRETGAFSCSDTRFELAFGARKLNNNHNDLQDEFYANTIDLFAKLILIEIKCINLKNMSDVMLVSNDIVKFFDIYHEILKYILVKYPESPPLIENSVTSAIAVITNCIFLFQAKLLASDIDSLHWSNMICMMEKLRNYMTFFSLPPSSGTSLQRFLIERSHGSFNTNCTNNLYNVTNNINQVNISERSSDITVRASLQTFRFVLYNLKQHINSVCDSFNIQHLVIYILCSVDATDGHYSDDESSTYGNEDSGTDENSEHSV
ncbi:unnamed protein product [Meganyctiphanes norvegica]|uniref:Uncharacterized protein n=1 Tax=Meganyctiphanes norvegica TaxID=48144 RepID=A0AAV2SJW6_MEGNR